MEVLTQTAPNICYLESIDLIWQNINKENRIKYFWLGKQPYEPVWELQKKLHENRIIHRDLKPSDIMVADRNGEEQCVLIDFGTGRKADTGFDTLMIGTKRWSCWHNFDEGEKVGSVCDIYALGRVMFYMATGIKPWSYEFTDPKRKGTMEYKAEILADVSHELSTLIDDMIDYPNHGKVQSAMDVIK